MNDVKFIRMKVRSLWHALVVLSPQSHMQALDSAAVLQSTFNGPSLGSPFFDAAPKDHDLPLFDVVPQEDILLGAAGNPLKLNENKLHYFRISFFDLGTDFFAIKISQSNFGMMFTHL